MQMRMAGVNRQPAGLSHASNHSRSGRSTDTRERFAGGRQVRLFRRNFGYFPLPLLYLPASLSLSLSLSLALALSDKAY